MTSQIARGTCGQSQNIEQRLLSTVRAKLDAGREPRWVALAVAAWMHHVAITPPQELNDPLAEELQTALPADRSAATVVPALLGVRSIFDNGLAADTISAGPLTHRYGNIETDGLPRLQGPVLPLGDLIGDHVGDP